MSISHILPFGPEPASIDPMERAPVVLSEEQMADMDDTHSHLRTESGFITFDPVPLDTAGRIARTKQQEAARAVKPAGIDTWFAMLEEA
jgi:hypothetical protein